MSEIEKISVIQKDNNKKRKLGMLKNPFGSIL